MEKRGLTENDTDQVYALGAGGYYLRKDADVVRDWFNKPDELPELMKFADLLEKATISTIESGTMTKDLALITELENVTTLNTENFIKAIRTTLEGLM